MSDMAPARVASRDARIRALAKWAVESGIRFGDATAPTKLETIAWTWWPTVREQTILSYIKGALRILQLEGPRK